MSPDQNGKPWWRDELPTWKDQDQAAAIFWLKQRVDELEKRISKLEEAKQPSSIVINRVVDRDAYPSITPPPLGMPPIPAPLGPPGPPGIPRLPGLPGPPGLPPLDLAGTNSDVKRAREDED